MDEFPQDQQESSSAPSSRNGALLVASGILLSRLAGLIRESVFAHFFGNSDAADAFKAALRIPNFLQNLFGEGVLSASFIPVYANLLSRGEKNEADKVASAVACLLGSLTLLLVLAGMFATPLLIDLIAPGFNGEKRELAIVLVRILFPGIGLLVLSAWCLGILNSHRRFFLSYAAPVIWNMAIIGALLIFGGRREENRLAVLVAWGVVAGCALQLLVQLPAICSLLGRFTIGFGLHLLSLRTVLRNFLPVVIGRGVVQISAYIDSVLASLLPGGAVAALGYAQMMYLLPISLFGMSVSAAELPAMSSLLGKEEEVHAILREKLRTGLQQIAFFVIPSAMAFFALGDVIIAALYQSGKFSRSDTVYVWTTLAGSSVGLVAATFGRLYASTFYALRDTKTPLKFACIRVAITGVLGYFMALHLPSMLDLPRAVGIVGLTVSAGMAAWLEYKLLQRSLRVRIGDDIGAGIGFVLRCWLAAILGAAVCVALKLALSEVRPFIAAVLIFSLYGALYFTVCLIANVAPARSLLRQISSRLFALYRT